jgi:hypothetical protein
MNTDTPTGMVRSLGYLQYGKFKKLLDTEK